MSGVAEGDPRLQLTAPLPEASDHVTPRQTVESTPVLASKSSASNKEELDPGAAKSRRGSSAPAVPGGEKLRSALVLPAQVTARSQKKIVRLGSSNAHSASSPNDAQVPNISGDAPVPKDKTEAAIPPTLTQKNKSPESQKPAAAETYSQKSFPIPAEPTQPNGVDKKRGSTSIILIGVAFLVAGWMYIAVIGSKESNACEEALTRAAMSIAGGNAAEARNQVVLGMASCNGEGQAKAQEMLTVADKAIEAHSSCERSIRQIGSKVSDRRLASARSLLDQLDTACSNNVAVKDLQGQITAGQVSANAADEEARRLIAAGDLKSAAAAVESVASSNLEFPSLPELRKQLEAAMTAKTQVPDSPLISTAPQISKNEPESGIRFNSVTPASNQAATHAQSFLRDAETALSQMKFDEAKSYVNSALRVDPHNSEAHTLSRRIRERELQYLKAETLLF